MGIVRALDLRGIHSCEPTNPVSEETKPRWPGDGRTSASTWTGTSVPNCVVPELLSLLSLTFR